MSARKILLDKIDLINSNTLTQKKYLKNILTNGIIEIKKQYTRKTIRAPGMKERRADDIDTLKFEIWELTKKQTKERAKEVAKIWRQLKKLPDIRKRTEYPATVDGLYSLAKDYRQTTTFVRLFDIDETDERTLNEERVYEIGLTNKEIRKIIDEYHIKQFHFKEAYDETKLTDAGRILVAVPLTRLQLKKIPTNQIFRDSKNSMCMINPVV